MASIITHTPESKTTQHVPGYTRVWWDHDLGMAPTRAVKLW